MQEAEYIMLVSLSIDELKVSNKNLILLICVLSFFILNLDHNTRSTSWQRPNSERLMHFATWQNQRSHVVSQGNQRFLYPQQQQVALPSNSANDEELDGNPLPDGWERRVQPDNRVYFVNHKNRTTQW